MKDLKGTKTEANLQAAFAGESQARNKYTYYASKAKKDGYVQIGQTMRRSMPRYGSSFCMAGKSLLQRRIFLMQLKARTMSGQTCMLALQRKPGKRALLR